MATRGIQLFRTDDTVPGRVSFYDRRVADAKAAHVVTVDVMTIPGPEGKTLTDLGVPPSHPVVTQAVHGVTQNILDSSNKLEGTARVNAVREMGAHVQSGGWASAPVDEAAARKKAYDAIMKLPLPPEVRAKVLADAGLTVTGEKA